MSYLEQLHIVRIVKEAFFITQTGDPHCPDAPCNVSSLFFVGTHFSPIKYSNGHKYSRNQFNSISQFNLSITQSIQFNSIQSCPSRWNKSKIVPGVTLPIVVGFDAILFLTSEVIRACLDVDHLCRTELNGKACFHLPQCFLAEIDAWNQFFVKPGIFI